MKHKITMIIKDGLTYVECTACGTQDKFKTFDDTDKFKQRSIAGDWELNSKHNLTCITCNRTTPFYNWNTEDHYY